MNKRRTAFVMWGLGAAVLLLVAMPAARYVRSRVFGPPGPRITFSEVEFDAGTVSDTSRVHHAFRYKNTGNAPLSITNIQSSCGCAAGSATTTALAPRQMSSVDVTLSLASAGPVARDVVVYSNASNSPTRLVVKANYRPKAMATPLPSEIAYTDARIGVPARAKLAVEVLVDDPNPIRMSTVQTAQNNVSAKLVRQESHPDKSLHGYHRTSFHLDVTALPSRPGPFADTVILAFDPPSIPNIRIPVTGRVLQPWVLRPERVLFVLSDDATNPPKQGAVIENSLGVSFSCAVVHTRIASLLNARATPTPGSRSWELTLAPTTRPALANLDDELLIEVVAAGRKETLRLPVVLRTVRHSPGE